MCKVVGISPDFQDKRSLVNFQMFCVVFVCNIPRFSDAASQCPVFNPAHLLILKILFQIILSLPFHALKFTH